MSFIRSWAAKFSKHCVVKRRLPAEFGGRELYISTSASLQYWLPRSLVSKQLFPFAKEFIKPGDSVWDVGANVGIFSFAAANLAGKDGFVLAVEPDYWLSAQLARNSFRQYPQDAPVGVLAAAVSDKNGISRFNLARASSSVNYLEGIPEQDIANGTLGSYSVSSFSLDKLLEHFRVPDVLKIDIEGAELLALQGAKKLLNEVRPIIHCEVSSEVAKEVAELFLASNYRIFNADEAKANRTDLTKCAYNTLAIPA